MSFNPEAVRMKQIENGLPQTHSLLAFSAEFSICSVHKITVGDLESHFLINMSYLVDRLNEILL